MAALSITASAVLAASDAVLENGTFGEDVTQGQVVYKEASTGKYKLADADHATAEVRVPYGIALNAGSNGQPGKILKSGNLTINAAMTAGTAYYLSPTAGAIGVLGDLTSGDDVVVIGVAKSTTVLSVAFNVSGVTL